MNHSRKNQSRRLPLDVFHRVEEVGGRRMLERPAARVLAERVVERLRSEDLVAQQAEADGRLHVGVLAEELRIDAVRVDLERLVDVVLHVLHDLLAIACARAPRTCPFPESGAPRRNS